MRCRVMENDYQNNNKKDCSISNSKLNENNKNILSLWQA